MPATEIELDDGDKSIDGVVQSGDVKQHLGMAHETNGRDGQSAGAKRRLGVGGGGGMTHFVILSSMLRGSRIKVGRTTRLRSAPGRSWEIMWERTAERMIDDGQKRG